MGRTAKTLWPLTCAAAIATFSAQPALAADFDVGNVHASWVTQITAGAGIRTEDPSCSLTGDPHFGGGGACGASANTAQWANGHNGDLNYKKWQPYAGYLKGTTELLLTAPDGYKFMGRGTGFYDFAAGNTDRTDLSESARKRTVHDLELLDLWASKDYDIAHEHGHVRVGNQVINWGESLFATGGINATNALDIQKLLTPGTQLKEAVLPSPMVSMAQGLARGVNVEAYYQFGWNHDRFPPVGTFWSTANYLGKGVLPIMLDPNNPNIAGIGPDAISIPFSNDRLASQQGQFGINLHYKPPGTSLDLGFYFENYHDKTPNLQDNADGTFTTKYLENRQLYGISANFPVGDWAIGAETSYRPRDAVSLTPCYGLNGPLDIITNGTAGFNCKQWIDKQKYQTDLVGLLSMTPSDYAPVRVLRADTALLTIEGTWIYYPGVSNTGRVTRTIEGQQVQQGYLSGLYSFLENNSDLGYQIQGTKGTANSAGLTMDYNWTYDGTVIPGWQMTPGVTFFYAFYGYTPNAFANYEKGAKSLNFYVLFNQNPAVWQAGMNFTHFFGGGPITQPLGDRDNIGLFVTRNF
jgi:hypothetical protein